jgi:hypothetical protein
MAAGNPGGPSNIAGSAGMETVRAHLRLGRPVRQHTRRIGKSAKTILAKYRWTKAGGVNPQWPQSPRKARKSIREDYNFSQIYQLPYTPGGHFRTDTAVYASKQIYFRGRTGSKRRIHR